MTQWYYSDHQRNRHGPVNAEDLAMLHDNGQLAPETLVWREGLSDWKPWREMVGEVVTPKAAAMAADPFAEPAAPSSAAATAATIAPTVADNAYRPYAVAEPIAAPTTATADGASLYAPPQARVESNTSVIRGGKVVYAGFWKRVAASFIDSIVTAVLSWTVQIPLLLAMGLGMDSLATGADPFSSGASIGLMALYYLASIAIPLSYFAWMHSSAHQATLGKMAIGIKVTRNDGERISFWRAFARYWAIIPSGIILGIGYLMAAFTERKQALHDIICDTLVVDKHAFTDHPEWQREELGTVTIVILVLFGLLLVFIVGILLFVGAMAASGIR